MTTTMKTTTLRPPPKLDGAVTSHPNTKGLMPDTPSRAAQSELLIMQDHTPLSHYSLRSFSTLKTTKWVPRSPTQMRMIIVSEDEKQLVAYNEQPSPDSIVHIQAIGNLELPPPLEFPPARKKSHAIHPETLNMQTTKLDSRNSYSFDIEEETHDSDRQETDVAGVHSKSKELFESAFDRLICHAYQEEEDAAQSEGEHTDSSSIILYCCQECDGCSQCCLQVLEDDDLMTASDENRNDDDPPRKMNYDGGYFVNHNNQCERIEFLIDSLDLNGSRPRLSLPNLSSMEDEFSTDKQQASPFVSKKNLHTIRDSSVQMTRSFDA